MDRLTGNLLDRYASPEPVADAAGTPFAYDGRNILAQYLMPAPTTMATYDPSLWRQRMGAEPMPEEWAHAEGSPWKRGPVQNALMAGADALNSPTGTVLSTFLGPAGARLLNPTGSRPAGIRAYHGSPHDFDRFDMSKIGTGEGAQAYGRGLYFAENEGVAKSYRNALSGDEKVFALTDGGMLNRGDPSHWAAEQIARLGSRDAALRFERAVSAHPDVYGGDRAELAKLAGDLIDAGAPLPAGELKPRGRMYEVNINADPAKFIDYDKPFAQQPPEVQRAVEQALFKTANKQQDIDWHVEGWRSPDAQAHDMQSPMQLLQYRAGDAGTEALREAGIPGIRYKDQMSRGTTGGGTSNYVVFDDKLIEILRKYGLAGLMAGGAGMAGANDATADILSRYAPAPTTTWRD